MLTILNKFTGNNTNTFRKVVAVSLLQFLEDKYDTKKWIVLVMPELGTTNKVYSVHSGGVHKASAQGLSALAVSTTNPNEVPEFFKKVEDRFIRFSYSSSSPSFRQVYAYLNRYLTPLQSSRNGVVETLIISSQCSGLSEGVVTTVASSGAKVIKTNSICGDLLVIVVKVLKTKITPAPIKCLEAFGYMSAEKTGQESDVILDSQWTNEIVDCANVAANKTVSK